MESWSYISGGKGSLANEGISTSDCSIRSKDPLMSWEIRNPYNSFGNNILPIENQGFGELSMHDLFKKQLPSNSIGDVLSSKIISTPNAFSGEDETTSKLSSTVVDSPLIDLKLGRFGDQRDAYSNTKFSQGVGPVFSSSGSSMPPKRARLSGMNFHTAYCQVYGCNKDLSSSKDYHKRHKVCEVHSKTAKVIVNGIEQRFCQQCSRFHLLAEFDDGKRSCRKRLAGHNERRRKPQVGIHSGRTGKLLHSYDVSVGSRFQGSTLPPSSFICQDILPRGIYRPEKSETNDWCKRIKVEAAHEYGPLSAIPITNNWSLHPSSFYHSNVEKLVPPLQHDPFFHDTPLASEDIVAFDTGLSGISDSGCALSLLSSKSQNSSKFPLGRSLVMPAGSSSSHHNTGQVSLDKFGNMDPITVSECCGVGNAAYGGGSDLGNAEDGVSREDGATIDLLQLSSQLQRVEHQRQSMQVEHQNDGF